LDRWGGVVVKAADFVWLGDAVGVGGDLQWRAEARDTRGNFSRVAPDF
jgi:hypothetical protein